MCRYLTPPTSSRRRWCDPTRSSRRRRRSAIAEPITLADPERALATAYAPPGCRAGLAALFALDERLGAIVAAAREPTIGRVRLAWWREAIEALATEPPPTEPLLVALADIVARGVGANRIAAIEPGWAALLDGEDAADTVTRHEARGRALFDAAAVLLNARDGGLADAGAGWALADLCFRHSDAAVRDFARARGRTVLAVLPRRWSAAATPLAALAVLARRDIAAPMRRPGSPARMLRMLALRITGR